MSSSSMFAHKLMIFSSLLNRNQKTLTPMYLTQNVYKLFTSSNQHNLTIINCKTHNFEDTIKDCEKSINNEL